MVRDVHVKEKEEDYKRLGDFDNSREYFDTYVPNQCYNFFQKCHSGIEVLPAKEKTLLNT